MPTNPHYPRPIARLQAAFDARNSASANLPCAHRALHARVEVTAVKLCATNRWRDRAATRSRELAARLGNEGTRMLGGGGHELV